MAKTKQQQLLGIYLTICFVVVSLLMKVDSVRASSVVLDGNMLQQHQQQQQQEIDNNVQEHNYIMDQVKQRPTATIPKNANILENDDDDKGNSLSEDLTSSQLIFSHPYDAINMVKRAPSGFVGMRGKKLYYDTDGSNIVNDNSLPWNQLQSSDEDINWDEYAKSNVRRYKKAPTAFYGVRGKKFATINGANPNNGNHRWQEFLQKLDEERVRNAILQNFVDSLTGTQNDIPNEMEKRAPTGFTGVRGKRPVMDELDSSMETLTKRGLGNNAFVGVRGKKDVSHQTFKRSPSGAEICDHEMYIRAVDGRFGGASHDSHVWNLSQERIYLKENYLNGDTGTRLLGDSGYPLEPWLMTPYKNSTENSSESFFNEQHSKGRSIIERTFGLLKARFRCLLSARELHYAPKKAVTILNVCCALHNICVQFNVDLPPVDLNETTSYSTNSNAETETHFSDIAKNIRNEIKNNMLRNS